MGNRLLLVPGCRLVLQRDDGRVLLQLRRDLNIWGLPGGCAEPHETLGAGAARELQEETGLVVEEPDLRAFAFSDDPSTNQITFPNGDMSHFFVLCFEVLRWKGTPVVNDGESLAFDWFAPDALPEMLPSSRETVAAHQRFRQTGVFQYALGAIRG